jgi:hypothetical protein
MESLYPSGKLAIPAWNGVPRPIDLEADPRVNELSLPEGPRP